MEDLGVFMEDFGVCSAKGIQKSNDPRRIDNNIRQGGPTDYYLHKED
jgi:hypothetical protein